MAKVLFHPPTTVAEWGYPWHLTHQEGSMGKGLSSGARWSANCILLAALAMTGCAAQQRSASGPEAAASTVAPSEARPLVVFIGNEPNSLATRAFAAKGRGLYLAWRI